MRYPWKGILVFLCCCNYSPEKGDEFALYFSLSVNLFEGTIAAPLLRELFHFLRNVPCLKTDISTPIKALDQIVH
jgi:hypothetical protein